MKQTLLFLLLFITAKGYSQTNVSGNITSNTTWTKAASPYVLTGNVGVPSAYTLTVEAGVRIERYADNQILLNGALQMQGTETDSIVLFSNYSSSVETKSFIEFAKSNLSNSSLRFISFQTGGNPAVNIRVGNEQPNNQTNPKNSGTLLISRSNLSNGFAIAAGYQTAATLTIDSSAMYSAGIINNRNISAEPITITNTALVNSNELTGNGDNRINHYNCTFQDCKLQCAFGLGAASFNFDSCHLANTSVTGFNGGGEGVSFLRSVNVNSPFAIGGHVMIANSSFTVNNEADFSQFSTDANNQPIFIVAGSLSTDSTFYEGTGNVTNLYINRASAQYGDTIIHNSFTGFKNNIVVRELGANGIIVDYNNFLHSTAATVYDISNLTTVDFYARYNYFELYSGKTVDDYIYDTNDDLSVGLVIIQGSVLPVQLLSFSGVYKSNQVTLQWKTSNETNVSSFIVQHLENGNYADAGSVVSKGSSNNTYTFTTARVNEGTNTYRLKTVDKDGKISFSSLVIVKVSSVPVVFTIYPNPASRYVVVTHGAESKPSQLLLADANGKEVKRVSVAAGDVQNKMELAGLAKGNYHIIWRKASSTTSNTLVIQ